MFSHLGGDAVDVQRRRPRHVAAPHGHQVAGELRRALGGMLHLLEISMRRVAVLAAAAAPDEQLLGDERAVVLDDGEQVVEVVRDAADELAQAVEPLGPLQALGVALPLCQRLCALSLCL
jgi:hypothetical protein